MAAVEAIQDAARVSFPAPRRSGKASADASVLDVRVKWPNDLYYGGGQKIGGVLCASTYADGAFDVVVGVGINLDNPAPTTCVNHIIEAARRDRGVDADEVPFAPVTREALAARFATRFEALARVVAETRGFDAIEAAYLNMWMHTGQEVTLIEEGEEGGEGREVRLRIEGLTRDGYLLAKDGGGGGSSSTRTGTASTFSRGSSGKNSRAGRRRRVCIEHDCMTIT
jgi:biotin--protein ligase